jgi:catechol 1,2-dioxygenase
MTYQMSRRGFFRFGAGSALALGATACLGPDKGSSATLPGGGKADGMTPAGECAATDPDALGPYWTPYLRRTTQLAAPEEPGQRLVVMGRVLARDCATAVPGATVVAWQADDEGLYDYNHAGRNQGSSAGFLSSTATRLRGLFTTSMAGTYAIETIFPSEYPLNLLDPANSAYRAPHIHFAVFVTDRAGAQHQLVTQMYFMPNDVVLAKVPRLDELNAEDFGASTAETPRLIDVTGGDVWHGEFDLILDLDPSRV